MEYGLGVDLGTTHTAAAVRVNSHVEVARLGSRRLEIPSLVFVRDGGEVLIGEAAERRGATEPGRLAREFKRRVGDPVPLLVGGAPYSAHALMARLLREVLHTVTRHQESPPAAVTVTHPANWGPYKRELLDQAVRLADLDHVTLRSEPEAAAVQYAAGERVRPDEVIAVYDLGGGTFDAAVLRKTATGFTLLGEPEGIEQLGGIDFDEAVFGHVVATLGGALSDLDPDDEGVTAALARLRRDCVEAKEGLSFDTEVMIPVALPGLHTRVRLNRSEFEAMITPALGETVAAMRRALRSAGVTADDLRSILLAGGSSRIPLVGQMLSAEFHRPVVLDPHPEHSIALGAALVSAPAAAAPATTTPAGPSSADGPAPAPTLPGPSPARVAALPGGPDGPPGAEADRTSGEPPGRPGGSTSRRSPAGRLWLAGAAVLVVLVVGVLAWLRPQAPARDGTTGDRPPAAGGSGARPTDTWSVDTGRPITGRPAVAGNLLYFGSQNGKVYAVDRTTHGIVWERTTGGKVVSSPAVLDGVVYTASQDGFVYALGADRGDVRWRKPTGAAIHSSPTIVDGILYIGSNDNAVYAFDLAGNRRWRFATKGVVWSTPAVADGLVYAGSKDGHLYAIDADTGARRWATRVGEVYSSPTVADGTVFIGSSDRKVFALDARTGAVRWNFSTNHWVSSSPLVRDGVVYAADFKGTIFALDARAGGERWRHTVPGDKPIFSSPALAGGVLYIGSHDARLYALDAATGAHRWDFLTDGIVGASPLVADGFAYVGSDDGRMYGLRLPGATVPSPTP